MKVLSYDALARDFRKTWASIESNGEEVVVTRDRRPVARIVPETQGLSAAEMFGDLHGVLGEAAGATLARKLLEVRNGKRRRDTLRELRNPWAS
ncbi:MAG: type II toxin-antitoxin system Phd/YefM family antitoxin [Verrucomicrobiales bacterium]|nr:type II toxin-antitoxin system Phd/YefM family antitoxin [Verrucomicrobiales bacterium]